MSEWLHELSVDLIYRVREYENLWDLLNSDKKKKQKKFTMKIAEAIGDERTVEDWKNGPQSVNQIGTIDAADVVNVVLEQRTCYK